MLSLCELMMSNLTLLSQAMDRKETTIGQVGRAKSGASMLAREVTALAREVCGGNGIILDNHVMKSHLDIEAMHTYEGTYEVNMLVSGRELTGGLSAFKSSSGKKNK
jgi:alkylation response protein AidB-like acyl-CoA dehydrogenase